MPNSEKEPNDILMSGKNTEAKKSKKLVFLLIVAIVIVVILIIAIWTLSREVNKPVSNIIPVDKSMEKLPSQSMDTTKMTTNSKDDLHLMPLDNQTKSNGADSSTDISKTSMDSNASSMNATPLGASNPENTPSPVATPTSSNVESKNPLDTKFSSLEDDPKFKALLSKEEEKKAHNTAKHESLKPLILKHENDVPKEVGLMSQKAHEPKEHKAHNAMPKNAKEQKASDLMHKQMHKKIADEKPKAQAHKEANKQEANKQVIKEPSKQVKPVNDIQAKKPLNVVNGVVATQPGIYLQVGVFSQKPNAKFIEKISKYGYKVKQGTVEDKPVTRYLLGPYKSKLDATKDVEKIGQELEIGKPVYYEIK
ncbi:hypothetical protein BKH43_03420 [Helicobacter sp. 13S00401-1]|uniref:SPOR domain-containing protein n=1 Tax=Helicobacter sp. 13S00401-1 TaxID=1905758 RepID=UPI000BA5F713|nr:SPOR domain-containing protein [Helicobacter sp. 13S00401-1]PAF50919.1 hypothetical protein BKH43_03420 [Helicobacter sp. 13S00401-1]